jgi:ribose 1,5-bisphosphokinase
MTAGVGAGLIGPGRLLVVVGPSGAGKDTLIARARTRFERDPTVVFPRRIVTRAASDAEDHRTVSEHDFAAAARAGAFAFWWEAHALKYALPVEIDDDVRADRTVVCNVSRGILGSLRGRYACLGVVLVTAPPEILAARLAARGRVSDGDIARRIARAAPADVELSPDHVIENVGDIEQGAASLVAAIAGAPESLNRARPFDRG